MTYFGDHMPYPSCSHRKDDGVPCGSPALHGQKCCYLHTRQRRDAIYRSRAHRRRYERRFTLPALDNPRAIQDLLWQVAGALAADTIDYRRASGMLSAVHTAPAELRRPPQW